MPRTCLISCLSATCREHAPPPTQMYFDQEVKLILHPAVGLHPDQESLHPNLQAFQERGPCHS